MKDLIPVLQTLVPMIVGEVVPWLTKGLSSVFGALPDSAKWAMTAVLAPVLTGIVEALTPGGFDPAVSATVGTAVALHAHAQLQQPPMPTDEAK